MYHWNSIPVVLHEGKWFKRCERLNELLHAHGIDHDDVVALYARINHSLWISELKRLLETPATFYRVRYVLKSSPETLWIVSTLSDNFSSRRPLPTINWNRINSKRELIVCELNRINRGKQFESQLQIKGRWRRPHFLWREQTTIGWVLSFLAPLFLFVGQGLFFVRWKNRIVVPSESFWSTSLVFDVDRY